LVVSPLSPDRSGRRRNCRHGSRPCFHSEAVQPKLILAEELFGGRHAEQTLARISDARAQSPATLRRCANCCRRYGVCELWPEVRAGLALAHRLSCSRRGAAPEYHLLGRARCLQTVAQIDLRTGLA